MIGNTIKDLRELSGWSRQVLATKLHVSGKTVANWEAGCLLPSMENLVKLAKVFFVSCDYLLDLSDDLKRCLYDLPTKKQQLIQAMLEQ